MGWPEIRALSHGPMARKPNPERTIRDSDMLVRRLVRRPRANAVRGYRFSAARCWAKRDIRGED